MRLDMSTWSTAVVVVVLASSALVIGVAGTRLVHLAQVLARRTGLGQAVFGAIFLGGITSLPGIVTSVVAAAQGHPSLAVSNAVGGIAAQTMFLVLGDAIYRRANLEHAAASLPGMAQGALLITLLAVVLLAMTGPPFTILGVHLASVLIAGGYVGGMWVVSHAQSKPMWSPARTPETMSEKTGPTEDEEMNQRAMWIRFALLALLIGGAGFVVARAGVVLSNETGLSETVVGGYLTAIATSLPELVTTLASIRRGALRLAVGDILGGNAFDVLFIAVADVAWHGSIYHAVGQDQLYFISLAIFLTGLLLLGLIRREEQGFARIGFESTLMFVFYVGSTLLLWLG